jgi:hypothetical protein
VDKSEAIALLLQRLQSRRLVCCQPEYKPSGGLQYRTGNTCNHRFEPGISRRLFSKALELAQLRFIEHTIGCNLITLTSLIPDREIQPFSY